MTFAKYIKRDQLETSLYIRSQGISTPVYDNSDMWFSAWKHRNRAALETYFDQLNVQPDEEHICTLIQWEREKELIARSEHAARMEMQEELYQYSQQDDEVRFSIYDRDTGIPMIGEI